MLQPATEAAVQESFSIRSWLSGLLLCCQLADDGALAIAILFALQSVVHGCQADVRLQELRRFRDQSLEHLAGVFHLAGGEFDGSKLVADSDIAGTHAQ